jgi:DNA invertase Pin-like site-specific DNA recombinase
LFHEEYKIGGFKMDEIKRVWIYCRIDATEDTHGSLKGQKKELFDYAEQLGIAVVGSSEDIGSGLNFDRSGLAEVLEAAETGKMDVLIIKNLSRLGRDTTKTIELIKKLTEKGIHICSPLEGEIQFTQFETLHNHFHGLNME